MTDDAITPRLLNDELRQEYASLTGEMSKAFDRPIDDYLLAKVQKTFLFSVPSDEDLDTSNYIMCQMINASRIVMRTESVPDFTMFLRQNKTTSFAGEGSPDPRFPIALSWLEIPFEEANYPVIVPARDIIDAASIRVKNVAILASVDGAMVPFEKGSDWKTFDNAALMTFVLDTEDNIHVYTGAVSYGKGGAVLHPIRNWADYKTARSGHDPRPQKDTRLSSVAIFSLGMLIYQLMFYKTKGLHETNWQENGQI
jgi:hypothetical protein